MTKITPESVREWLSRLKPCGRAGLTFEFANDLAQAYLALAEQREWRPMNTAPTSNGHLAFMAFVPGHGCVVCHALPGGIIVNHSGKSGDRRVYKATHWMPLPQPPGGAE